MINTFWCFMSILLIALGFMGCTSPVKTDQTLRVMSFNIRYSNPDDGVNTWPDRKDIAVSMIRFHRADLAGLREALKEQVDDLEERLPEYNWFGVGRDDGDSTGEFMAITYRKDLLELLAQSTLWLSETT